MSTSRRVTIGVLACVLALSFGIPAWGDFENPKAIPPLAKPNRQTGGESMGPLPLPGTTLRRSEKKREPAAPALVGMINFSDMQAKIVDGQRVEGGGFPTTHIDIERLVNFANSKLNIRYRYLDITLDKFSWDPQELPVLYLTGWTPLPKLSDTLLDHLRRYLYDGGTLVIHAQCGRQEFIDTARREIARILPNRQLAPLDTDSPLFNANVSITKMRVRKDAEPFKDTPPYLEAIYLGCRPALIFSPIDLNCGWDVVNNPIQGGILYHQEDGLNLGLNIITTALANFEYARAWGTEKVYHQQAKETRSELVIAQIKHNGDWDPTPHALPNLMKHIQNNTTLDVQFKRELVDLSDADVFKHPVLYMTGLRGFTLTKLEQSRLKNYLSSGGVLIADSSAGNKAFDESFRREIKEVLGADLKPLGLDNPLYTTPYKVQSVEYTPMVKVQSPNLNIPTLEGIVIDGQLAVIYSQLGLSNGWEQLGFAYNRGYSDADALRLGVNIFAYALMH